MDPPNRVEAEADQEVPAAGVGPASFCRGDPAWQARPRGTRECPGADAAPPAAAGFGGSAAYRRGAGSTGPGAEFRGAPFKRAARSPAGSAAT
ncbi:hypothetical protein GCM10009731_13590 [Streptomyces globosus]